MKQLANKRATTQQAILDLISEYYLQNEVICTYSDRDIQHLLHKKGKKISREAIGLAMFKLEQRGCIKKKYGREIILT